MSLTTRIKRIQQLLEESYQVQADQALAQLLASPKYQDQKRLNRYEHKVFSQSGEDGVIAEIFRRIGTTNRLFAECAPGEGIESNTHYLLILGWKGLWMESNPSNARRIRETFAQRIESGALILRQELVTAENVESLLDHSSLPAEFDLLSIDLDGNDYWIWKAVQRYRPRVVVIEYNAIFPPACAWIVPYAANTSWDQNINYGASLASLELLGAEKGYKLVGCALAGTNAFFVREDLVGGLFCDPFTAENHYEPPRYYLTFRKAGHSRTASLYTSAHK